MSIKSRFFKWCFPELIVASSLKYMPYTSGIVLMYHEVLPDKMALPAWTVVRESEFRWQMSYLLKHFDVVYMDQAIERVSNQRKGKKPFAVVTFDDGYRGNFHTVLPIMKSMGIPFVVYAATQAIVDQKLYWYDHVINLLGARDGIEIEIAQQGGCVRAFRLSASSASDYIRWQQVERILDTLKRMPPEDRQKNIDRIRGKFKEKVTNGMEMLTTEELSILANSGCVTVGSHTHGHELLNQLCSNTIQETIKMANEQIARITGRYPMHFSYPNGNYDQRVLFHIQQFDYKTAVTTRKGRWTAKSSLFEIPRIGIGRFDTRKQYKARISNFL